MKTQLPWPPPHPLISQFSRSGVEPKNVHFLKFWVMPGNSSSRTAGLEIKASPCAASYREPGMSWVPDTAAVRAIGISIRGGFCGREYSMIHHTAVSASRE